MIPGVGTHSHTSYLTYAVSDPDFVDDIALLSHNHAAHKPYSVLWNRKLEVETVLFYRAETWTLTKGLENTGWHLHLVVKICSRNQMARPPDQCLRSSDREASS